MFDLFSSPSPMDCGPTDRAARLLAAARRPLLLTGAVPTNDRIAATLQQRGCPVITINPDPTAGGHLRPDVALPLAVGDALTALDRGLPNPGPASHRPLRVADSDGER